LVVDVVVVDVVVVGTVVVVKYDVVSLSLFVFSKTCEMSRLPF